jgi:8-oxo-dGTP diphosphatase
LRETDKTAEQCALRELKEETNLTVSEDRLWQLGVFSEEKRDPRNRVISLAYYALVEPKDVVGGDDAAQAQWFDVDNVPELAFDHVQILSKAREAIKRQIHFDPIGYDLLGEEFTISQVQTLYETIHGVTYDRRNFARKIQSSGFLRPLGKKMEGTAHKAPQLFSCDKEAFKEKAQMLKFEVKKN